MSGGFHADGTVQFFGFKSDFFNALGTVQMIQPYKDAIKRQLWSLERHCVDEAKRIAVHYVKSLIVRGK